MTSIYFTVCAPNLKTHIVWGTLAISFTHRIFYNYRNRVNSSDFITVPALTSVHFPKRPSFDQMPVEMVKSLTEHDTDTQGLSQREARRLKRRRVESGVRLEPWSVPSVCGGGAGPSSDRHMAKEIV